MPNKNTTATKAKSALKNRGSSSSAATTSTADKSLSPSKQKYDHIAGLLEKMKSQIQQALPKHITPDRIARIALNSIRMNPKLLQCSEMSLLGAIMQSAQLGLEPNSFGQAWLIPFNNKKKNGQYVMEVQFQVGYKGLIELFYRTDKGLNIDAHEVYENDKFDYNYGVGKDSEAKLYHKPVMTNRGSVIGYYATATMKNGSYSFLFMSKEDVKKHANTFSQAYKKGWMSPWKSNFDEMAKKTVIKKLMKYLPLSVELQKGIAADETIKNFNGDPIDETPDQTDFQIITHDDFEDDVSDAPQIESDTDSKKDKVDKETGEVLEEDEQISLL